MNLKGEKKDKMRCHVRRSQISYYKITKYDVILATDGSTALQFTYSPIYANGKYQSRRGVLMDKRTDGRSNCFKIRLMDREAGFFIS